MTDHIRVGKIHYHHIEQTRIQLLQDHIPNLIRAHLRLHIVSLNLRRGHDLPFLAVEGLLTPAVKEKRHVSIFLRLCASKLLKPQIAEILPHNILEHLLPRKRHRRRDRRIVLGHANIMHIRPAQPLKSVKTVVIDKGPRDLTRPVAAKIKEHHRIAIFDDRPGPAIAARNAHRLDKLIGHLARITRRHRLSRTPRRITLTGCQAVIRPLHTLPPVIPIHRIKPARYRRDLPDTSLSHLLFDLRKIARPAGRRRIPTVRKRMKINILHIVLPRQLEQPVQMLQKRMNANIAAQTHQMQLTAIALGKLNSLKKLDILKKLTLTNRTSDPNRILINNPPSPNILMPNLAIAHSPIRQTNILAAGMDQTMRIFRHKHIVNRSTSLPNSIKTILPAIRIEPPTITNDHQIRPMFKYYNLFCHKLSRLQIE